MKTTILIALLACALAACSDDTRALAYAPAPAAAVPMAQAAPAPVVVQAAPQHSGMQDMLTGAALGALATHALTSGSRAAAPAPQVVTGGAAMVTTQPRTTRIIERTVIVKQVAAPAKPAAPSPAAKVPPTAPRPATTSYTPPRTSYAPPARVVPSYKPATSRR